LQLLVELGVIPVLLLSVLLVLWWRGFRKAEAGPEHGWLLMVLAILSLHSLIDNPLWHAHFLGIAAVVLGLGEQKTYPLQLNVFGKWTVGLVLLALLGLGLHERHNYKRLEHLVYGLQVGAFSFKQGEFISGISQVGQKAPLLEPYVGMLFTAVNEIKEGNNSPLLPVYEHALHFMPGPYLAYRDVLLLALADKPNEATVLLTQALNAYPAGAENLVKDLQSYSPAAQQKTGYLLEIIKAKGNEKPD
jgi:hypothetical protein